MLHMRVGALLVLATVVAAYPFIVKVEELQCMDPLSQACTQPCPPCPRQPCGCPSGCKAVNTCGCCHPNATDTTVRSPSWSPPIDPAINSTCNSEACCNKILNKFVCDQTDGCFFIWTAHANQCHFMKNSSLNSKDVTLNSTGGLMETHHHHK